ncbi:hypothetical protein [Streptomyces sp. NPDC001508]|uniref:hypothetical protein n=1 Tax=Streptomyces sp. NPDC001508 TaxID=3154656 RepID=UPI003329A405
MPNHIDSGRLASFADVLASELPGAWTSVHHTAEDKDDLTELVDNIWDMDVVAESLAQHPPHQAAVLTCADGAQLVVLDRHDKRNGFLAAAIAPRDLPAQAFQAVREPDGIALTDDPFLSAELIAGDLLARYETALTQVRQNATDLTRASGAHSPQPERVILSWLSDGSLGATPASDSTNGVLIAHGFVRDEQKDIYRLQGGDSAAQASTLHKLGLQLAARNVSLIVRHAPSRRSPTTFAPTPAASAKTSTARSR